MRYVLVLLSAICLLAGQATAQDSVTSEPGFVSLFNGTDLAGWKGDKRFWRVEQGAIVGQTSADNPAPHNTFLIRPDDSYGDFELRFSYQVDGFNSGVQYRSVEQDDYVVSGYQADFEARWHDGDSDKFSGMFFEENGRMFLAQRGQAVVVRPPPAGEKKPAIEVVGSLGDAAELESVIRRDDWNDYTVIAKGFQFTHLINGRVVALAWDEDTQKRRDSGIFAFQLHSGTPMQIKIKDIRVRRIDN
ncbi:DUF1080 domain-containing protein [Stieleria sp. TO1_6]|uniref:3-keto-disaccharide hydrolase n=1 Tax=Stieleria tagensis TaxID=2956795 RepID=UPI00209B23E1|nr:DUF1080 domain-containing protein [Stieleria tagensis]MCO8122447.1 DUF1080 domain-containing protein [Stieleria tagensis]